MSDSEMIRKWWIAVPVPNMSTYCLVQYGQEKATLNLLALCCLEQTRLLDDESRERLEGIIASKQSHREDGMVFFTSLEEQLIEKLLSRPNNRIYVQYR